MPLAQAALGAQHPLLRRLGARQLGRALTHCTGAAASGTSTSSAPKDAVVEASKLVHALLTALQDVDTGVASAAESALVEYGKQRGGRVYLD